jgi:hypothetical protein
MEGVSPPEGFGRGGVSGTGSGFSGWVRFRRGVSFGSDLSVVCPSESWLGYNGGAGAIPVKVGVIGVSVYRKKIL